MGRAGPSLSLAEEAAAEAIADAFETGRTPDWFAIARAITGSHARDLGFPITERTDHEQA